jgi:hypothetical protein
MADPVSLAVSVLALAVSATTAWLTLFRRGVVKMTQPTVIFFGPDVPRPGKAAAKPKVYLRTLLFATSKRGRVVESMHVSLARSESRQNFNIWVYGEFRELVRGSGLFVGESGVAANHHFLTPDGGPQFEWAAGQYQLNVYAKLLGNKQHDLLFSQSLHVAAEVAMELKEPGTGLYFDWGPDSSRYLSHVENRLPSPDPAEFFEHRG